ncbi:hypothetical protein L1987_87791 [Smallanthus sonchifolius]|nr:hypothetical protein L1987_87791 [Smallanthus sonchifolius]
MTHDNWIKSAMDDTDLVVHVLFKLRHASPPPPPPKSWTIRQRRSRPSPPAAGKKSPAARASPTTPLSWSGATSASGGGVEESSRPVHDGADMSGSKVNGSNETTPTKRPRKKQLASLQATCLKQRKDNESLKKMKDDTKSQVLASSDINESTKGKKNDSFVLPDLNIPVGDDY